MLSQWPPCDKVSSSGCCKCEPFLELWELQLLFVLLFLLAPSLASDRLLTHTCWSVSRWSLKWFTQRSLEHLFLSAALSFWVLYPANSSCSASLNFNCFFISGLAWLCLGSSFLPCSQKTAPNCRQGRCIVFVSFAQGSSSCVSKPCLMSFVWVFIAGELIWSVFFCLD